MDLKAKMPSKVEALKVAVGDAVAKGAEVAVIEAMKMKTPLLSPVDGTVKSIAVAVGDRLKPGGLIMVIE
ncbi:acetyl-CoA carboxylase biotin carboxyl carrier protein subunit [Rhodoplanes sp. TEM]|uniref:Acetyl-CoA carboxylase biotin carboxyl carrier protein subunit n=1 Tax=Rhodoplanes tepidamans TaxID=200616 RepID=A0ABT5J6R0_RHOTP|nr:MULTISPECIES: biotin/lipoyl-containing protein [Rhodoplanes]MDC7784969.1 acetyl-CoA carboxylase biotin carboxyl carrier protein subunit [Rhodoplanes tepidamans]MDC7985837.1 acetyl-CoA carboxylase biotin carboxyl carrier protein subunit [Rhodoplanes sp. TEM]MDQ0353802.1 biotin carboxyl carrier protein [Rhodoplanes tepidamans]